MIKDLNRSKFTAGALIPFANEDDGADRAGTLAQLADALLPLLGKAAMVAQYSAPLEGAAVAVVPSVGGGNVHLIIATSPSVVALSLPAPEASIEGQEVLVSVTSAITINVAGAAVALGAGGFARWRWDALYSLWRRVG